MTEETRLNQGKALNVGYTMAHVGHTTPHLTPAINKSTAQCTLQKLKFILFLCVVLLTFIRKNFLRIEQIFLQKYHGRRSECGGGLKVHKTICKKK